MKSGTMAILDHMIIWLRELQFVFRKTFAFEKTLLGEFVVVRYLPMTVGFDTMGLQRSQKFETLEIWDLGAMELWDKANVDHMSLGLSKLHIQSKTSFT